jgi:hypothetical protein
MATHRHHSVRLTLGMRMAILPAVLAAASTLLLLGTDALAVHIVAAVVVGALVLFAIALPVDRLQARNAGRRSGARRGPTRRR